MHFASAFKWLCILSVTNNAYNFESFENVFTYINSPILSMVVPSFVTEGAATSLHIHGKSLTNQSICIFYMNDRDSMPLKTNATIISPNLARCASVEELSLGIYSLRIAALDDSFRSLNVLSFEVKKIFSLRQIIPLSGPSSGGTEVHLYGKSFIKNVSYECVFGTAASAVTIYDGYHGACIAPPSPIGRVIFVIRYVEAA